MIDEYDQGWVSALLQSLAIFLQCVLVKHLFSLSM